ncbi:MAG: Rieske 2Fe-2S domain-containing protein [Planctomycetota bacterium]
MSVTYQMVKWNRHKVVYDRWVIVGVIAFLATFVGITLGLGGDRASDPVVTLMRAFGACAITLLHVILCIGPLARLSPRFSPLLYNRRHLGVTTFFVGLIHSVLAMFWYGAFGVDDPLSALLVPAGVSWWPPIQMPFAVFGALGLLILFLLAATSHDFWNANLGPRVWKTLHMLVYVAYASLIVHVALGAVQGDGGTPTAAAIGFGVVVVGSLHAFAAWRELQRDSKALAATSDWIDIASVDDVSEGNAKTIMLAGRERVALLRHNGKLSAMSNVCAHQGGPLGEGKVIDGCLTCPWHGWQYDPANGCSPPPYTEKVPTYELRVEGGRVLLNPEPKAAGTRVEPVTIAEVAAP